MTKEDYVVDDPLLLEVICLLTEDSWLKIWAQFTAFGSFVRHPQGPFVLMVTHLDLSLSKINTGEAQSNHMLLITLIHLQTYLPRKKACFPKLLSILHLYLHSRVS